MEKGLFKKGDSNVTYLNFGQIKVDGKESVQFYKKRKQGEKYIVEEVFDRGIVGSLLGVFNDSYTYDKNTEQKTIVMFMDIGDSVAKITMNQNYATRGMVNSLLTMEDFGADLNIWTTYSEEKDRYIVLIKEGNRTVYPGGRKTLGWKYGLDVIPPVVEVKVGNKTIKDTSDIENFFVEKVEELNAAIGLMTDQGDESNWPKYGGSTKKSGFREIEEVSDIDEELAPNKMVAGFLNTMDLCTDPSSILAVQDAILAKNKELDDEDRKLLHEHAVTKMKDMAGDTNLILISSDLPF